MLADDAGPYALGFKGEAGEFIVLDDKPYVVRPREGGPEAVDIKGNLLRHYRTRKMLAYPLDGDAPVVSLGKTDATSQIWDLSAFAGGGEGRNKPVAAGEGKFKGWYLDYAEKERDIIVGEKVYHARQLILVKSPNKQRAFR